MTLKIAPSQSGVIGTPVAITDTNGLQGFALLPAQQLTDASGNPITSTNPNVSYTPGGLQTVHATTMTRPADTTAYAAGDLVANSTTAASVTGLVFPLSTRVAGEAIRIERLRLRKSGPSLTNASFRVYICRALPTLAVGDNGAFNASGVLAMDNVQYVIGWFDITMDRGATVGARGVGVPNQGNAITLTPIAGTTLYGLIEATAAYAPVSAETWDATLEGQWS